MIINNHQLYVTDYYDYINLIKLTIIVVLARKKRTNTQHFNINKRYIRRRGHRLDFEFENKRTTRKKLTLANVSKTYIDKKKQKTNCEAIPGIEQLHVLLD